MILKKLRLSKLLRLWRRRLKVWRIRVHTPRFSRQIMKYFTLLCLFVVIVLFYILLGYQNPSPPVLPTIGPVAFQTVVSLGLPAPAITAKNYFILDLTSRQVLLQKSADSQIYPASTTKMMTALVVIDHFPLTQTITVTKSYPEGQDLGFQPGEQLTVEQLLYALLVYSANDAAEIFAENYVGGREAFISAMNQKVSTFGLNHTHFSNPTGLDEDNHYSSAADLVRLADLLMKNPELARIVSTENAVLTTKNNSSAHIVTNINELLGQVEGVLGVKTGFTDGAGQALVTLVSRDNHPVMISVMGSIDRFHDTRELIEWIYANHRWIIQPVTGSDQLPAHTP